MNSVTAVQEQNARNMKDFLELYNKLTEQCFLRCVVGFGNRTLSSDENSCINVCAERYIKYNQRLMFTFMEFQNAKQEAAIREMERAAAEGRPPNLPGLPTQGPLGAAPQQTPDTNSANTNTPAVTSSTAPS